METAHKIRSTDPAIGCTNRSAFIGALMRGLRVRLAWTAVFFCALACVTPGVAEDANAIRLQRAAKFLSAGNLDRAESELQSVLRASPGEYRALDLLGVVRVLQHRQADAEALFRHAIQSKADFAGAHAHLGLLYAQAGRDAEAIPELQAAVRLDSARKDASDALLQIFRQQAAQAQASGDWKRALGSLLEARKLAPKNADVQFEFATAAFEMSLLQDAVDGFQATLSERKNDALAVYGLGRAYGGLGKLQEARQQFVRYIALRPGDPSGYCSLGITLAALERPQAARAQFAKSIALAPDQTEAYLQRGTMELHLDHLDAARRDLQHVLDRDPQHAAALSALGRLEFTQKHYPAARDLLTRALSANDSLLEAHYYLGLTYARLGQKPESGRELQRAGQLQHEDLAKRQALWKRIVMPPPAKDDKAQQ